MSVPMSSRSAGSLGNTEMFRGGGGGGGGGGRALGYTLSNPEIYNATGLLATFLPHSTSPCWCSANEWGSGTRSKPRRPPTLPGKRSGVGGSWILTYKHPLPLPLWVPSIRFNLLPGRAYFMSETAASRRGSVRDDPELDVVVRPLLSSSPDCTLSHIPFCQSFLSHPVFRFFQATRRRKTNEGWPLMH